MMKKGRVQKEGFTLIELLVVIAVIGVLASVIMASLNSARSKARDARRRADMDQLTVALTLYYDKYGAYPLSSVANGCSADGWCRAQLTSNWVPGITEFLPLPVDPSPNGSPNWGYLYSSNGKIYTLEVPLENTTKDTCAGGAGYPECSSWTGNQYVKHS